MKFIMVFALTLTIIVVSLLFMMIRILIKKGGRFRALHIGQSREMKRRGIDCVQSMDAMERKRLKLKKNIYK